MGVYPANTFPSPNKIALKTRGRREEKVVSGAAVYPGYLVMPDGSGGIKAHNVFGKLAEMWIVEEQGLRGIGGATVPKGAYDTYDVGELARFLVAAKGDLLQVLTPSGQNLANADLLVSNGDGTFVKMAGSANAGGNLYETVAASSAITASSTETAFSNGAYSVPANFLQVGDLLHVRIQGIATATNSTDTLTVKLYLGGLAGTAIVSTGALDVANGDEFLIDAWLEVRTIGASGTFIANGTDSIGTPGTATVKAFLLGSTALDTTAAQAITVSGTWSTTNAGNSCRLDLMTVDLIRQAGPITPLLVVDSAVDNTSGTGTTYPFSPAALVPARVIR